MNKEKQLLWWWLSTTRNLKNKEKQWSRWWLPTMRNVIGNQCRCGHVNEHMHSRFTLGRYLWQEVIPCTFYMGQLWHATWQWEILNHCVKGTNSFSQNKHFGSFEGICTHNSSYPSWKVCHDWIYEIPLNYQGSWL